MLPISFLIYGRAHIETQGREMQHGKHCVTQCERILRRRRAQGRETQHGKHCETQ